MRRAPLSRARKLRCTGRNPPLVKSPKSGLGRKSSSPRAGKSGSRVEVTRKISWWSGKKRRHAVPARRSEMHDRAMTPAEVDAPPTLQNSVQNPTDRSNSRHGRENQIRHLRPQRCCTINCTRWPPRPDRRSDGRRLSSCCSGRSRNWRRASSIRSTFSGICGSPMRSPASEREKVPTISEIAREARPCQFRIIACKAGLNTWS